MSSNTSEACPLLLRTLFRGGRRRVANLSAGRRPNLLPLALVWRGEDRKCHDSRVYSSVGVTQGFVET